MFFDFLRRKRIVLIVISVIVLVLLAVWVIFGLFYIPDTAFCEGVGEYSLIAETKEQREEFFMPFGYKAESYEDSEIIVPSEGESFKEYNEIQKSQGLDLVPYAGEKAQLYVLSLEDSEDNEIYGFLIVYRNRVIGGHISDCVYPARVLGFYSEVG